MLKPVFGGKIVFDRFAGFQTHKISLLFNGLRAISGPEKEMVPVAGIEPATFGLQNRCSTS